MRLRSLLASAFAACLLAPACSPKESAGDDTTSGSAATAGGAAAGSGGGGTSGASAGAAGAPGGGQSSTTGGSGGAGGAGGAGGGAPAGAGGTGGNAPGGAGGGAGAAAGMAGTGGTLAGAGGSASGAGGSPSGAGGDLAVGGSGASAGAGPAVWHAKMAAAVTEQLLASEYASWKSKHVQSCSDGSSVVKKDEGSVVSEGIGYGLLLAVSFDDRALFDGLLKYYKGHEDPNGLMNWSTGVCDAAGNNNAYAATDGDLDAAMALVQAAAHWPDGSYASEAETLAKAIMTHETELCDTRAILRPGDNFGGCSDMNGQQRVNPSYFAPGYYRVFAAKFPDQAERWNALVTGSYDLYPLYQARMSGLVPDWAAIDGGDWYGASYSYDACRTPWRVMVDFAWSGEPKAQTMLEGVTGWVAKNGTGSMPNNSAFLGSFALAAAYDQSKLDAAVASWLAGNGDDTPYFQGTLRLLYLLAAAGKFPSTL